MLLVYLDLEQSHFTKWITVSGAGGKDAITGLNLPSTKFQSYSVGCGNSGFGMTSLNEIF